MANTNTPYGLIPLRGDAPTNPYSIASLYNTAIGLGDPVEMTGTGTNVALAAAGNPDNVGVFAGCEYTNAEGQRVWKPNWVAGTAATDIVAHVWDCPRMVFRIQIDTIAEADVGLLVDWVIGTPSSATGRSTSYAGTASKDTAAASLRIKRLVPGSSYGAYADIEVMFAEHIHLTGAAGAGGV
jgi:hypothetical protein